MRSVFSSCAGNHLGDGLEAMLLVARIDALRRIADGEIGAAVQPRRAFQARHAILFDRAGIDGRFVNDDIAALEEAADRIGGRKHRAQIRTARGIDGRRHGDDIEVGRGQRRRRRRYRPAPDAAGPMSRLPACDRRLCAIRRSDSDRRRSRSRRRPSARTRRPPAGRHSQGRSRQSCVGAPKA